MCVYGCTCVKSKCFITKNDLFFFFIFYCICFIPRFVQIFNCLLQFVLMSNTHGSDEKTIFFRSAVRSASILSYIGSNVQSHLSRMSYSKEV